MKDRYINSQLTNLKEEKKKIEKSKDIAVTTAGLATVAFGICTIGGLFAFPGFALSALVGTGASLIARRKYQKLYDDREKRLDNEINHLEKISKKTPNATTELNRKRVKKIKALKNRKQNTESSYEGAKSINGVAVITELAGIGLSFVNPMFSLLGFGGLALNLINTHNMISKNKQNEEIKNRINNITNDLEVIINEDRDKQGQRIGTRKVMKPKEEQNTNTKVENKENERIVDIFLNNMANKNQTNNPTQKVKK